MTIQRVVACVFVQETDPYRMWLGDRPLLRWTMTQLAQARCLSRVVLCGPSKLPAMLLEDSGCDDFVVWPTPPGLTAGEAHRWVVSPGGPADTAHILVAVRPWLPLLPATALEQAVEAVSRNGGCAVTAHASPMWSYEQKERPTQATGWREAFGFRVLPRSVAIATANGGAWWDSRLTPIPVTWTQTLDAADPEQRAALQGLVH